MLKYPGHFIIRGFVERGDIQTELDPPAMSGIASLEQGNDTSINVSEHLLRKQSVT